MTRRASFAVACDSDPDSHPLGRRVTGDPVANWRGITHGIAALRRRLLATVFASEYGQLPVTWLLRADRQIDELHGDAAFCFHAFAGIWNHEQRHYGSEIGWHPHLYRWNERERCWIPYLGMDDDVEVLASCLTVLRACVPIESVRTGWCYHSNTLMQLFDRVGLQVDASALPGSFESHRWRHDWRGTGRKPFRPSCDDYRRPGATLSGSLSLHELPMLVQELPARRQAARYGIRAARALRSGLARWPKWDAARWQGVIITRHREELAAAVRQTIAAHTPDEDIFIGTYFHTGELLVEENIEAFAQNVDTVARIVREAGIELEPATLSSAWRRFAFPPVPGTA